MAALPGQNRAPFPFPALILILLLIDSNQGYEQDQEFLTASKRPPIKEK
jgi:hypothetical protein